MNELMVLQHEDFGQIRAEVIDGQPWFNANDVCRALGLSNPRRAIALHCFEGDVTKCDTPTESGIQAMNYVNESGLYTLIFGSKKESAKKFKQWVTSEVLPSIRETGAYQVCNKKRLDFVDLRGVPYEYVSMGRGLVRVINYNDVDWYSINDVHRSVGVRTGSGQAARKLNACGRPLAIKILISGNTHPAWFASTTGIKLIVSGSRAMRRDGVREIQLTIENF